MNVASLIKFFGALALCLYVSAPSLVFAEQVPVQKYNPVEMASFHQLVFADEDIAILNNRYPPKGDSGFHAHHRDLFAVIVEPAQSSGQGLDKALTPAPLYPLGAVAYSAVGAEPRVHRVVNDDDHPFHIIVIELRRSKLVGTPISSRDGAPQYEPISDVPRLGAWRLILGPGDSVPAITQGNKGVRVVVRGGLLTTITPGSQDQQLFLQPGDFSVQMAGTTRALKNTGTQTIELVEMELK